LQDDDITCQPRTLLVQHDMYISCEKNKQYLLLDMQGRYIMNVSTNQNISLTHLAPSVYILMGKDGKQITKIIKI